MKAAQFSHSGLHLTAVFVFTGISALAAAPTGPNTAAIPFTELGAKATADYQGDALAVTATRDGARLRCGFQKLEARATAEGLWLESTAGGGKLRVVARSVSRDHGSEEASPFLWAGFDDFNLPPQSLEPGRSGASAERRHSPATEFAALCRDAATKRLTASGKLELADKLVRFIRPGLTEEYSVSVDGVRQDFIIEAPPLDTRLSTLGTPPGELRVELALSGARAEAMAYGARLTLEGSNRSLAYSRLRATDATGKELKARMEVSPVAAEVTRLKSDGEEGDPSAAPKHGESGKAKTSQSLLTSAATEARLAVVVDDADAVYPVRIDPTFSDEDWISMGGLPGVNGYVYAAVADDLGNLYIGGGFWIAGDVLASRIAKWDGNSWSALGSGMNNGVHALAVAGSELFAGGYFTNAGGAAASRVAKWNGSGWSGLGSGVNGAVLALAISSTNLIVGGQFTTAGGSGALRISKWNGANWSPLGSGLSDTVRALVISGSNVFAGGDFTLSGSITLNRVARWSGSSWSALGTGLNNTVQALAVAGTNLYAGGSFTGPSAYYSARWNGSSWTSTGLAKGPVYALTASGSNLFIAGTFASNKGSFIANFSGTAWSYLVS